MLLYLIYYAKSRTFNVEEQTIEWKLCVNKHLKNKTQSITYSVAQRITGIYIAYTFNVEEQAKERILFVKKQNTINNSFTTKQYTFESGLLKII